MVKKNKQIRIKSDHLSLQLDNYLSGKLSYMLWETFYENSISSDLKSWLKKQLNEQPID
jgi:hypothetical protein